MPAHAIAIIETAITVMARCARAREEVESKSASMPALRLSLPRLRRVDEFPVRAPIGGHRQGAFGRMLSRDHRPPRVVRVDEVPGLKVPVRGKPRGGHLLPRRPSIRRPVCDSLL